MKQIIKLKILFLSSLFFISCLGQSKKEINIEAKKPETNIDANKKLKDRDFKELVGHFKSLELPLNGRLNAKEFDIFEFVDITLKERYAKKRIPIDTTVKYFHNGKRSGINQPSGGIYEYYYGYQLPSNGDYVALFYFRPSDDTYYYRIATFNYKGKLIDDIGVGGQLLEEAYKEFKISKDLKIETTEFLCDMTNYDEEKGIVGFVTNTYYKIQPTGKIELEKEEEIGQYIYIDDKTTDGFDLILKKSN